MGKPNVKLRELRGKKTLAKVADDLGISPSSLAMYERGDREPRDEMKKRLAEYYGRSVAFIFFRD